jgi:hypothetical protein
MGSGEGDRPDDPVSALVDCESHVEDLRRENKLLRDASRTFGALAERLNQALESERRLVDDRRAVPRASGDRRQKSPVAEPPRR